MGQRKKILIFDIIEITTCFLLYSQNVVFTVDIGISFNLTKEADGTITFSNVFYFYMHEDHYWS